METLLRFLVLFCSFLLSAAASKDYEIHDLKQLCDSEDEAEIKLKPWKAAIIRFGHPNATVQISNNRNLHKCIITVLVDTREEFGLAAVIEEMRILGSMDRNTNAWNCNGDYVKLSTTGSNPITKLLNWFPGDLFKSKSTDKLCGRRIKRNRPIFTEVGANANVLSTLANNLEVEFHQAKKNSIPHNNYFQIIVTPFKHNKHADNCQDQYRCFGNTNYCISKKYRCDGHPNCAFPAGGGDEINCVEDRLYHPIFSTTTTIITVLAAIVGAGIIFGCLLTLCRKIRSCESSRTEDTRADIDLATAPALNRQHTLPPYEAVVMADIGTKTREPPSPTAPEFPPSYDTLFPEGRPTPEDTTQDSSTPAQDSSPASRTQAPSAPQT